MRRALTSVLLLLIVLLPSLSAYADGACDDDNVRERLCDPEQKRVYSRNFINMQRVWMMMAVFDFDENRVNPAVVDIGFLDDGDVRAPENECWVNYVPSKFAQNIDCDADIYGEYEGVLLATGNDAYKDHGNNMKGIIGATLNDGGAAGVAGQVAVPNLYRLDDVAGYLFELGPTIRQAVDDGSTVINISGGFPCTIQLNTPPNSQTPNLCTDEGRALFCATASLVSALPELTALVCFSTLLEGDLVSNIALAAQYATDAGVPIVASAGNISTEWLTDVVDLTGIINWTAANSDAALWSVIPATVGPVIAAGAADDGRPYGNQDFHGARVNVWAPFTDTSPAAAFVSGLISLAQATNPELSPLNENLSTSERRNLAGTLRTMLVDTAYTNTELVAFCPTHQPTCMVDPTGLRGNMVNPYRFVRTAATDTIPNFEALGYSDHFDSFASDYEFQNDELPSDSSGDDDWRDAVTLNVTSNETQSVAGTIFYVPGSPELVDRDWFQVQFDGSSPAVVSHQLELRYLSGFGELTLSSPHDFLSLTETRTEGDETVKLYDSVSFTQNARYPVEVHGVTPSDDNLYQLSVIRDLNVRANPDRFDQANGNNNAAFPDHNNSAQAATTLSKNMLPPIVSTNTRQWSFGAADLSIHAVEDEDHFRITLPAQPNDGLVYQNFMSLSTNNPDIRLYSVRENGSTTIIGSNGSYAYGQDSMRFVAKPKYPGLALSYEITGTLKVSPLEYNPLPDKALQDLEQFIENMQVHVNDRLPEHVACVSCITLKDQGAIQVNEARHPVGRLRGIPRGSRSLNYLRVDKSARVIIDLDQNTRSRGKLEVYDAKGKRVASSGRGNQLVADLPAGLYFAVVTGASRGERELGYKMRQVPKIR